MHARLVHERKRLRPDRDPVDRRPGQVRRGAQVHPRAAELLFQAMAGGQGFATNWGGTGLFPGHLRSNRVNKRLSAQAVAVMVVA